MAASGSGVLAESAHTQGRRDARPAATSDPSRPLTPAGPGTIANTASCGLRLAKATNQRSRHIARAGRAATNRCTRVIPGPPARLAAGVEAATAGVAAEAAAGAGRFGASPRGRAGCGWRLAVRAGSRGGRNGPRLGQWEKRLSAGCWGGGAAAPHSSQVRGTPRSLWLGSERRPGPAVFQSPPTWLRAPAGSVLASLGPASPPARTSPHLPRGSCPAPPPERGAPLPGRQPAAPTPAPLPPAPAFPGLRFAVALLAPAEVGSSPLTLSSPLLSARSPLLSVSSPSAVLAQVPSLCSPSGRLPGMRPPPQPSRRDQIGLLPSFVPGLLFRRITLIPAL